MLDKFEETVTVTEMGTFKHEPFLLRGANGMFIYGALRYLDVL